MINEFKKFPKVELHVHLDCCLSFDALKKISPEISLSTYKEKFIGTGSNSLKDYIKCEDYIF
jgi:adenosine deaminase